MRQFMLLLILRLFLKVARLAAKYLPREMYLLGLRQLQGMADKAGSYAVKRRK